MRISIITVVFNNVEYIEDTILSVLNQSYGDIEHIIIDGSSIDGTVDIIKSYEKKFKKSGKILKWISEKDNGIYDAMNKGIELATGDIIGFLNSDDLYYDNDVINNISNAFQNNNIDATYGDLIYVSKDLKRVKRYWRAGEYVPNSFKRGWMPPHPTFFLRKEMFKKYGKFNTDFKISGDYELMLRLIEKNHIIIYYIKKILVKMRMGGKSNNSLKNLLKKSYEDYKAWGVNKIKISPLIILLKPLTKISQLFVRENR